MMYMRALLAAAFVSAAAAQSCPTAVPAISCYCSSGLSGCATGPPGVTPTLQPQGSSNTICVTVSGVCNTTSIQSLVSTFASTTCTLGQPFAFYTSFSSSECAGYDTQLAQATAQGVSTAYCTTSGCNAPAVVPASCPANGATACAFSSPMALPMAMPMAMPSMNITQIIQLEAGNGMAFTPVSTGLCFSLTITCNAAMGSILQAAGMQAATLMTLVGAAGCLTAAMTPVYIATGVSSQIFGAFAQSDCTGFTGAFAAISAGVTPQVFDLAFNSFQVCNTNGCNTGYPAPPGHSAAPARAVAAAALAAAVLSVLL